MADTTDTERLYLPALGGIYDALKPLSYPVLRIAIGLTFVPHGAQKLFHWFGGRPVDDYAKAFGRMGDFWGHPGWVYYIGCLEFFGGLMLAAGFLTRVWAAQFVGFMATAVLFANAPRGWFWTSGGSEAPFLWGVICLYLLIHGAGAFSLDRAIGPEI